MPLATCPSCDEDVLVPGRAKLGEAIACGRCGSKLEVISTYPVELDWASDDLDDLEGDEYEDDDDLEEDEPGYVDEDHEEGSIDDDKG